MTTGYDLIAIGDTTIDTFLAIEEANVLCDLNRDKCQLCINYASKIPVSTLNQSVGGNSANIAVGTSRLGLKTALISIIGDDASGKLILESLRQEGVDNSLVRTEAQKKTNASTVLNLNGERTILIYHEKRDYCRLIELPKTKMAYFTSMKDGWQCMCDKGVLRWIDESGLRLGYNPGTYQLKEGKQASKSILERSEFLFLNKQEAIAFSESVDSDLQAIARVFIDMGVGNVIITDGAEGAHLYSKDQYIHQPIVKTQLVEATGAGDAFASGFISAIHYSKDLKQALAWGATNAAGVITKIGAQAGLLHKKEILTRLTD